MNERYARGFSGPHEPLPGNLQSSPRRRRNLRTWRYDGVRPDPFLREKNGRLTIATIRATKKQPLAFHYTYWFFNTDPYSGL